MGGRGGGGGGRTPREKKFLRTLVVVDPGGRGGRPHPSEKKFLRTLAVVDARVPDENMDNGGGPEVAGRGRQGAGTKQYGGGGRGRMNPRGILTGLRGQRGEVVRRTV